MHGASRKVWFLVTPGSDLLDVSGPWEVFGHASDILRHKAYELHLFGPTGPEVRTRHGLRLSGVRPLPRGRPRLPDVALIAGGAPVDPLPSAELLLSRWLARNGPNIATIASICTGAFVLGRAGMLDGRRVTTHWQFLSELRARFPRAIVVDEGIFVHDGALWSSAGITAGIDLALALVESHHGHSIAMQVAKRLVLFLRRSGGQAQFSSALARQEMEPAKQGSLVAYVLEHMAEGLPVTRLASAVGMSSRSLTRWCGEALGESPAELVRRLRLEQAKHLLEATDLPLKDISARTGLGDASTLWRVFTQRLGVTPAIYRERFRHAGHSEGASG